MECSREGLTESSHSASRRRIRLSSDTAQLGGGITLTPPCDENARGILELERPSSVRSLGGGGGDRRLNRGRRIREGLA